MSDLFELIRLNSRLDLGVEIIRSASDDTFTAHYKSGMLVFCSEGNFLSSVGDDCTEILHELKSKALGGL